MIIRRIELKNILSHENTSVEFPDGVVAIIGPNGAGKSSIVDSMYIALFSGKQLDVRGGKKEHIIMRGNSSGEIRVEVEIEGRKYLITRKLYLTMPAEASLYLVEGESRRLKATRIEGVISEVAKLLGLTGLTESDVRKLVRSTIIALQGELTEIVDIGDAERREYILSLLGLSYLEKALEALKEITKEKNKLEGERKAKEEALSAVKKNIEKLKQDEERIQRNIVELEEKIRKLDETTQDLKNKLQLVNEYLDIARNLEKALALSKISELERVIEELREVETWWSSESSKLQRLLEEVSELKRDMSELEQKISILLRELNYRFNTKLQSVRDVEVFLDELKSKIKEVEAQRDLYRVYIEKFEASGVCPLCGSSIRDPLVFKENLKSKIHELERIINELSSNISLIAESISKLRDYENKFMSTRDRWEKSNLELRELLERALALCRKHNITSNISDFEVCVRGLSELGKKCAEYRGVLRSYRELYAGITPPTENIDVLRERLRNVIALGIQLPSSLDLESIKQLVMGLEKMQRRLSEEYDKSYNELSKQREFLGNLRGQVETIRQQLEKFREDVKKLENELTRIEKRVKAYEIIEKFAEKYLGKNGLVARELTRVARSVLEKRANTILSRLKLREISIGDGFELYVKLGGENLPIKNASGGERVAVAIALRLALAELAMGKSPTTLILDEPTVYLDDERRSQIFSIIGELGRTLRQVIVITHDEKVVDVADAVIRVENIGDVSRVIRER
ncbi:MAG: AAA family ATPase [Desulfurococcaceae archaeon]|nr:AAA family ATPase [Desulfurococcaceae archaeon]